MTLLIPILVLVGLILISRKLHSVKPDTCLVFTGGLGSGKSLVSVQWAKKLLRRNRRKVKWHNLLERIKRRSKAKFAPIPILYSTIPVRVSRKEWSTPLKSDTPILAQRLVPKSVVFMDEVSLYVDQMTTTFANSDNLEEWATLFRHYTQGGFLVLNTQNTSKVNFHLRYCLNRAYNLQEWRHIWRVYWVRMRDLSLVDDVKSVSTTDLTDDYKLLFGWLPFRREYDTYVYSERVADLPVYEATPKAHYKTNFIAHLPKKKITPPLRLTDDPPKEKERVVRGRNPVITAERAPSDETHPTTPSST